MKIFETEKMKITKINYKEIKENKTDFYDQKEKDI